MAKRKKIDFSNQSFFEKANQMMTPRVSSDSPTVDAFPTVPLVTINAEDGSVKLDDPLSTDVSAMGMAINIGRRRYQQDAIAAIPVSCGLKLPDKWFGVLCDGMGGMNGGERASSTAIRIAMEKFTNENPVNIPQFYYELIDHVDDVVSSLTDETGSFLGAGTTFISVVIEKGKLWWASVGDSHIYVIRKNMIRMLVKEHNYLADLLELADRGEITREEAYADKSKDALTSYIGMCGVLHREINSVPGELEKDDIVMLCSDGLYRTLSDEEIVSILLDEPYNMNAAAMNLVNFALSKNNPSQDNLSVILARC